MSYCPFTGDDCRHVNVLQYDCRNCICFLNFKLKCTCIDCPDNSRCPAAFDPYNTNGDCLMSK